MTKKELRQNLIVVLNDVAEEVRGIYYDGDDEATRYLYEYLD